MCENATDELLEKISARRAELEAELEGLAQFDRPAKKFRRLRWPRPRRATKKNSDEAKEPIARAA